MSASKDSQSYKDARRQLKCGLCTNTFKDPRILSCLHSFCFHCIRRHVEKDKERGSKSNFPCPLCSRKIEVPKGGMKALQPNMYVVAQTALDKTTLCDICEVGNKAMEKCLDCNENLCVNCLSLHHKMKATRGHRMSTIGEGVSIKTGVPVQKIQQKQYCPTHEAEELRFFCVPCAKIVCRDCKTLNHTIHQTLEIGEVASQRKREVGNALKYTKDFLPKITAHVKALEGMVKSLAKNTQNTTEAIKKQSQSLHDEIDRITKEMVQEIKQKNKEMEATLQRNVKSAELAHASMDSIVLAAESFINVGSDHDVIENSGNIKSRIDSLAKEIPTETVEFIEFKFKPGALPSMELWGCFGTWTSEVATSLSVSVPRQMRPAMALVTRRLSAFKVDKTAIISIAPTNDGDAWVCNSHSDTIYRYDKTGKNKARARVGNDIHVGDLYVAADGSVLMSFPRERKIKRLTPNGIVTDFASTPLYPAGLTQTDNGDLLVCGMEKLDDAKGTESKGSILRVNAFGRCDKMEKDRQQCVFGKPIRIAVNTNHDICVSDWMKGREHVVTLTSDGRTKWKYFGPKTITLPDAFVPNAIACDKYSQLLIADAHNNAIHLLDKEGRFVKMLLTSKDGIGEPWAVAVDSDGFLWVGDTDGCIQIYKYMS